MGFFDDLFGKKRSGEFEPQAKGMLTDIGHDEIEAVLGSGTRAKGGFMYWRGSLADIDPDYDESQCFQLSNKDYRGYAEAAKRPTLEQRERWFVVATSTQTIKVLGRELGAMVKNVESV